MPSSAPVVVAGSGPAGLAIAAALVERGVEARVVSPTAGDPWTPTYGCWADEAEALGFADCLAHRWEGVVAYGHRRHEIARSYAVFDNERLQERLRCRLEGRIERGMIDTPPPRQLLIDARGHAGGTVLQTAYGVRMATAHLPEPSGTCVLMDWRSVADGPPTFLYALDLGDRWLVEETSLAARHGHATDDLRRRLAARLGVPAAARADRDDADAEVEIVSFPMIAAVPRSPGGTVVPFGARAGFVNPATGYSVITSLARSGRVADAIAAAVRQGRPVEAIAEAARRATWSSAERRSRALRRYGLGALLSMNADDVATFFDAFFDLPVEVWSAYMSAEAEPGDIVRTMRAVFGDVPWRLRRRLMTARWPAA